MILALLLVQQAAPSMVERANDARRPPAQGQAIEKLAARGSEAVPEILEFVQARGANALSLTFAESLGRFADARIAGLCAKLLADRDFLWRPAAARSLAVLARPEDRELLRGGLTDRLWGVRAASIRGLQKLEDKGAIPAIRERLADEVYDVRGQAARTLWAFGDAGGLPVLVEALRESTYWFDIDYGQLAREDAWTFLKTLSKDDFGYKPWEGEARRAAGLVKWDAWMAARDPGWREKIPAAAMARKDTATYRFGYELRSCQKGDFFFRVDTEWNLVLGCHNLVKAPLSAAERERFVKALESIRAIDHEVPYGEGGCDFEQFYLGDRGEFDRLWIGRRGRPASGDAFIAACAGLLEEKFGAGVARELTERAALFKGTD